MLTKYILSATNIVPSKVFTTEYILFTTEYILLPTEYNLVVYQVYLVAHQVRLKLPTGTRTARQHRGLSGESSNILLHWYPFLINNSPIPFLSKTLLYQCWSGIWQRDVQPGRSLQHPIWGPGSCPQVPFNRKLCSTAECWFQIDLYVYLTSN